MKIKFEVIKLLNYVVRLTISFKSENNLQSIYGKILFIIYSKINFYVIYC